MFFYEPKATTYKNINKFSYETYTDMSINMLKYNNDSSAVFRILDALTSSTRETLDDLPYSALFTATDISYKQIDRLNKFYLENVSNLTVEQNNESTICSDTLIGYSKYTDSTYTLEHVDSRDDFIRHSYPCDCFLTKKVTHRDAVYLTLDPNVWKDVNLEVNNSVITIKPMGPMDGTTKSVTSDYITVLVEGINIRNELVEENVNINHWCEFKTDTEFIYVNRVKVLNSFVSYDIVIYPYIDGKEDMWHQIITDREEFDRRNALIRFNTDVNKLEYSIIYDESIDFPIPTDLVKAVGITGLDDGETIYDYFIDQQNGLFYVITSANKLYCYPFIIPKSVNNTLDENKTIYQACRIEYFEDAANEKYVFDVFPTSKANGVDSLDILINGETYQEGMIIDLFREKLLDNRFEIPFSDLFINGVDCLIDFKTYGSQDSSFSIYIVKPQVDPLYVKDLSALTRNNSFSDASYVEPSYKSTQIDHPDAGIGSLTLTDNSLIYKLSRYGNIIIDGWLITDVFNTFYYSEVDNSIITSDAITHLKSSEDQTVLLLETEPEAGLASAGEIYETYRYI